MHSRRMRTVRCSGRLSCHACPLPYHARLLPCMPPYHMCPPPEYTSPAMHPPATHTPPPPFHVDRILDTRLWKHYLMFVTKFNEFSKHCFEKKTYSTPFLTTRCIVLTPVAGSLTGSWSGSDQEVPFIACEGSYGTNEVCLIFQWWLTVI